MKSAARRAINRENASHSTGPKSEAGKHQASMNAFKHGLTGQRLMLQPHEHDAYRELTAAFLAEHKPQNETQRQLVQHIIDTHTRLNRCAAIENNIISGAIAGHDIADYQDEGTGSIFAQSKAWLKHSIEIDRLGRYEARLTRQLIQYTKELKIAQQDYRQNSEPKPLKAKSASFGTSPESTETASQIPQPIRNSSAPPTAFQPATPALPTPHSEPRP